MLEWSIVGNLFQISMVLGWFVFALIFVLSKRTCSPMYGTFDYLHSLVSYLHTLRRFANHHGPVVLNAIHVLERYFVILLPLRRVQLLDSNADETCGFFRGISPCSARMAGKDASRISGPMLLSQCDFHYSLFQQFRVVLHAMCVLDVL